MDNNALEADLLWNSSYFWALIIHKSVLSYPKMTYDEYVKYWKQYEQTNNISINSDFLFEKFWLRKVLGFVEIPGGISRLCYDFKKYRKHKPELEFINYFFNSLSENDKKISQLDFDNKLIEYSANTNL